MLAPLWLHFVTYCNKEEYLCPFLFFCFVFVEACCKCKLSELLLNSLININYLLPYSDIGSQAVIIGLDKTNLPEIYLTEDKYDKYDNNDKMDKYRNKCNRLKYKHK